MGFLSLRRTSVLAGAIVLSILLASIAAGTTARAGPSAPSFEDVTSEGSVPDLAPALDFPGETLGDEFFLSPITGDAYRIRKDAARGTYTFCALSVDRCFPTRDEILALEMAGLPGWAVVVEPALRAAIAEGGRSDVLVVVELRDDSFSRAASGTWRAASSDLEAVEAQIALAPDGSPARRFALGQLDALMDLARRDIYRRAERDLAPLLARVDAAVRALGGQVVGSTPVLPAAFARIPLASLPALAENPWVRRISESRSLAAQMDVSAYAIGADTWWSNGYQGGTWDAGVMDTGIDPLHPALTVDQAGVFHALGQTRAWYNDDPTNPDDLHSHGTHVAGTVASADSLYRGVAYGLDQLINIKAGWLTVGNGGQMEDPDAMDGVDWAVGIAGADVISLSFGGAPGSGDTAFERFFDAVVDELLVGVAIAAGNSGPGTRTVTEPGAGINIVSAGAMADGNTATRTDDGIASFSGRGPTGDGRLKPDIVAPGVDIRSSYAFWEGGNPDFVAFSGTSMATPHVAASMILLLDYLGTASPMKVKALLLNSAEDRGTAGGDTTFGWGYEDLTRAYATRLTVYDGSVSDGPVDYVLYRAAAPVGAKATIVWNRHADYIGSTTPTTVWGLNDLDLLSYDEVSGARLASSMRTVDNVEQVVAPSAVPSYLLKVDVPGTLAGVDPEQYAIAADMALTIVAPPSLTASMSAPAGAEVGTDFTVTADVSNVGGLVAHGVSARLNLPANVTLVSGANPQPLGSVDVGGTAVASWQVRGNDLGTFSLTVDAASVSYDETFTAAAGPVDVEIIDSVPPVSSVDPLPAYHSTATFGVTATASDGSGVRSVDLYYRRDAGAWTLFGPDPSAPWAWTFDTVPAGGDGAYKFYSRATDTAFNIEAAPDPPVADASTIVDTSPPVSTVDALPTYTATATFTVTAVASDASGVLQVSLYARRASGPWTLVGDDTAAPWSWTFDTSALGGDGQYEFYASATDSLGTPEPGPPSPEASTLVDTTPPISTASVTGTMGANNWYVSTVTVELSWFDATSGVDFVEARVDGGTFDLYSVPLQVSGDGDHVVEFRATDLVGTVEALQQVAFRIDGTSPFTTAALSGSAGTAGWYVSAVTTGLVAIDNTSGVGTIWFSLDGGGWAEYDTPVLVSAEGDHTLSYYSVDDANNVEAIRGVSFRLDLTPPSSTHALGGTLGDAEWYVSAVTVTLSGFDALSGLGSLEARVDNGTWELYAGVLTVAADGGHHVEWRAIDAAGNVEGGHSDDFRIDGTPPEVAVGSPATGALLGSPNVVFDWSASDALSGLESCEVALDVESWSPVSGSSHTFSSVADGDHTAMVRCRDVAGNAAGAEAAFSVNTDPLDPEGPYGWWLDLVVLLLVSVTLIAILAVAARRRKKDEPARAARSLPKAPPSPEPPPPPADDLPPPPEDEFDWTPPPPD